MNSGLWILSLFIPKTCTSCNVSLYFTNGANVRYEGDHYRRLPTYCTRIDQFNMQIHTMALVEITIIKSNK